VRNNLGFWNKEVGDMKKIQQKETEAAREPERKPGVIQLKIREWSTM
jgi:hypothetical protein